MYTIVEKKISDKKNEEYMIEQIEGVLDDLTELYMKLENGDVDIVEWINENLLSVKDSYNDKPALCFMYGGPGLWINCDGEGIISWWGEYIKFEVYGIPKKAIDEIFNYLFEVYPHMLELC